MGKLLRLELFDFKSYRGHHTLLFGDSYFTSIIGPNGAGKSNSMDAISFVLGIKSSHIRSAHLKDLVYRGRVLMSAKINDAGSAAPPKNQRHTINDVSHQVSPNDPKTAWVVAVYEDEAGVLHKWKRSITDHGTSEYRINDRTVSAQQYNDALERENILIKARNFLVFQGDVEAIASQSPQDLTRLIEQISGSLDCKVDFDRLKIEADQTTEDQHFQLQRRRGLNSEMKQYQEQKREADNFQKKIQDRDSLIVTQSLWKLYRLQQAVENAKVKIQDHREELEELQRKSESFDKELDAAKKAQAAAARDMSKVERHIKSLEKSVEAKDNDLVPLDEKIAQTSRQADTIRRRFQTVSMEREQQLQTIRKLEKDLASVEKAEAQLLQQHEDIRRGRGRDFTAEDKKEYDTLRRAVAIRIESDRRKRDELRQQVKYDQARVDHTKSSLDRNLARIEAIDLDVTQNASKRAAAEVSRQKASKAIEERKKELNQKHSARVRTNQKRTELEERLVGVTEKLRDAEDYRRKHQKEVKLNEMVASLKRLFPGVSGLLGKLCKPKQKKFDEAVIIALGKNFNAVIVDNDKTAMDCIQHLKSKRFPPLTFIPLESIRVYAINTAVKSITGARLTLDTIEFDSSLERAMSYACGSSVLCDNMDIARYICYQRRIRVKAVTLEGFVIHPTGWLTGGRLKEPSSGARSFEDHDVENLERMAQNIRREITQLRTEQRAFDDEELRIQLGQVTADYAVAETQIKVLREYDDGQEREKEDLEKSVEKLRAEFEHDGALLETAKQTLQELESAIVTVEDEVFGNFCARLGYADIRVYETLRGDFESQAEDASSDFRIQKHRIQAMIKGETSRLEMTSSRLEAIQRQLQRITNDNKTYQTERDTIRQAMGNETDEIAAIGETVDELKAELEQKKRKVSTVTAEVQRWRKQTEARQRDISTLETAVQKNSATWLALLRRCRMDQVQIPLASGSLDNIPNDVMPVDGAEEGDGDVLESTIDDTQIEIDFDSLDEDLKDMTLDIKLSESAVDQQLQTEINGLNAELEKLNPNMRATERLANVETRLTGTDKEFEDARTAAKKARDAFNTIKAQRFELFHKAFTHIREQIFSVYRDLTRSDAFPLGGQAYLDIEEDSDMPYLSGVKYHAMPPLKRFRDMDHLSGGEKTMAALALLFAIHSYQPSPFFVLDEVDAALDNANVGKIKKYIREHARPGMQFILISLKASLFQDSDSLVGIYRDQDNNTSKALTLDLRKYAQ